MTEKIESSREELYALRVKELRGKLKYTPEEAQELNAHYQKQVLIESETAKQKTEFNRYKQDCRKRALEMAHAEFVTGMQPNAKISIAPEVKVETLADKYYNWLISIPQ